MGMSPCTWLQKRNMKKNEEPDYSIDKIYLQDIVEELEVAGIEEL